MLELGAVIFIALIVVWALLHRPLEPAVTFRLTIEGKEIMNATMNATQSAILHADPINRKGGPGAIEGQSKYEVSIDGIASLFPASDGKTCEIRGVAPGNVRVTVKGDSDLGAGVKEISKFLDLTITPAPAVDYNLTLDAPVDQ